MNICTRVDTLLYKGLGLLYAILEMPRPAE